MTEIEELEEAFLLYAPVGLLVEDEDYGIRRVVEIYVTREGVLKIKTGEDDYDRTRYS